MRDVARIELGAVSYDAFTNLDGKPALGIAVYLQSGGNALKVADSVKAGIARLAQDFPQGVTQIIPFDTTRFVESSIHEVIITLLEAATLVLLVVFVFLQSWRATLIPIIAVPVSLIGAFGGLLLFGFTINTLTLFAIVLATGIVVDDAIVVLENVERLMAEKHLSPKEAAVESMREVTGAIVAIELVLISVFVPVAFLGGLAGKLYQQFAVTVVTAVTISGLVALTLTPAMCALALKRQQHARTGCSGRSTWDSLGSRDATSTACGSRSATASSRCWCSPRSWALRAAAKRRSGRLRAARGSGLSDRLGDASGRRHAAAHAGSGRRRCRG